MAVRCGKGVDMALSKLELGLKGYWQMSGSAVKQLPWNQERDSEGRHEAVKCQERVRRGLL